MWGWLIAPVVWKTSSDGVSFDFCDPKTLWQIFIIIFIHIYAKKNSSRYNHSLLDSYKDRVNNQEKRKYKIKRYNTRSSIWHAAGRRVSFLPACKVSLVSDKSDLIYFCIFQEYCKIFHSALDYLFPENEIKECRGWASESSHQVNVCVISTDWCLLSTE